MSADFERAELGLRALFELARYDDQFVDLVEAAEAALDTVVVRS